MPGLELAAGSVLNIDNRAREEALPSTGSAPAFKMPYLRRGGRHTAPGATPSVCYVDEWAVSCTRINRFTPLSHVTPGSTGDIVLVIACPIGAPIDRDSPLEF